MFTSTLCLNWTTQQAACACCERRNICSIFKKLCFVLYGICFDETPTLNKPLIRVVYFYICVHFTILLQTNFHYVKIIHILFSTYFVNRLCFFLTLPSFALQNPPHLVQQVEAFYFFRRIQFAPVVISCRQYFPFVLY